jgi:hypothetical protein
MSAHSFLSCDRDFTQIGKCKMDKKCEVLMNLVKLIVNATPNNPFTTTLLQHNHFYDLKKEVVSQVDMYIVHQRKKSSSLKMFLTQNKKINQPSGANEDFLRRS